MKFLIDSNDTSILVVASSRLKNLLARYCLKKGAGIVVNNDACEGKCEIEIEKIRESLKSYSMKYPDTLYGNDPERLVKYYDRGRILFYFDTIDLLKKHSINVDDKKVADIGSFLPVFMNILIDRYNPLECHAYELNKNIIEISPYYSESLKLYKYDYFGKITEKYDVIFCMQVLEHLVNPGESFKAVLEGLSDGGIALFTVPDGRKDHVDAGTLLDDAKSYSGHINFWSPESWFYFVKSCVNENRYEFSVNEHKYNGNYVFVKRLPEI